MAKTGAAAAACAAATAEVLLDSVEVPTVHPGYKDASNPGLGAAMAAVSPTEIGGGAPDPAQIAALDPMSISFSLTILACLASASEEAVEASLFYG